MRLESGRSDKIRSFFQNRGKRFWAPILILGVLALGFGAYVFVRAYSSNDKATVVQVTKDANGNDLVRSIGGSHPHDVNVAFIRYGVDPDNSNQTWGTYRYLITTSNGTFYGMCAQPQNPGPSGDYSITTVTDSNVNTLKMIMLVSDDRIGSGAYSAFNSANSGFWDNLGASTTNLRTRDTSVGYASSYYFTDYYYGVSLNGCGGSDGEKYCTLANSQVPPRDYTYALGHMMLGYAYAGGQDKGASVPNASSAVSTITSWFNGAGSSYLSEVDSYTLYKTVPTDSTQEIMWLEYTGPTSYTFKIKKVSSANTSLGLSGASFRVCETDSNYYDTSTCYGPFSTGSDGYTQDITVSSPYIRWYEVGYPAGYTCNGTATAAGTYGNCYAIENISDGHTVVVENAPVPTAYIKIRKLISGQNTTSYAGLSVIGTTFCVYDSAHSCGSPNTTITINDANGYGYTAAALPTGTYTIAESQETSGFQHNSATLTVALDGSNTSTSPSTSNAVDVTGSAACSSGSAHCTFYNEPTKGKVSLIKTGHQLDDNSHQASSRALSGVYFQATNTSDASLKYCIGPTLSDGSITSGDMIYGTYNIKELTDSEAKSLCSAPSSSLSHNFAYTMLTINGVEVHGGTTNLSTQQTKNTIPDNPSLQTDARNSKSTVSSPDTKIEISTSAGVTDHITCSGLIAGASYQIRGELFAEDKTTRIGNEITLDFTGDNSGGCTTINSNTGDMVFGQFNSFPYRGQILGIKQRLYKNNGTAASPDWILIAVHNDDLQDTREQVEVKKIEIGTTANSKRTDNKIVAAGNVVIDDTISITGLEQGQQYYLRGYLKDASGNAIPLKDLNGQTIAAGYQEDSYTMQSATGATISTHMELYFDSSYYVGQKIYVWEYLYAADGTTLLAQHTPSDSAYDADAQSVTVITPEIHTTAADHRDGTAKKLNVGTSQVEDAITYSGLVSGDQYYLSGRIIHKPTNTVIASVSNQAFHPTTENCTAGQSCVATMVFDAFDTTLYYSYEKGEDQDQFLVQEWLTRDPATLDSLVDNTATSLLAKHTDDVADQSVQIVQPTIGTRARYKFGENDSNMLGVGDVTMIDFVDYTGLVGGEWYTIVGTIINPETGNPLEIDDKYIRNYTSFKADTDGTGTVSLEINLNTIALQGRSFVVYERLYRNEDKHGDGRLLAVHEDLTDTNQTVTVKVAQIGTTATDKADGDKVIAHEDGQTIHDVVTYDGLLMDEEYTLYGYLWDKTAEAPLLQDGKRTESFYTFTTPSKKDSGEIDGLDFAVDAHDLHGHEIVVFEYLFQGSRSSIPTGSDGYPDLTKIIAKHDLKEQESDQYYPEQIVKVSMRIGTEAADAYDGDHEIGVGIVQVIDNLEYAGVERGQTYIAKGQLVYKATGEPVKVPKEVGGISCAAEEEECEPTPATTEYTEVVKYSEPFTVTTTEEMTGSVPIVFDEFDSRELIGQSLVVYEELYRVEADGDKLIAEHKDLNDADQTVTVATPKIHTTATDKADGDKELLNDADVIVLDKVEYEGLAKGTTYTLKGQLVDKSSGNRISGGVTEVVYTFTAIGDAGKEELEFAINTAGMSGKEIVVYETLYIDESTEATNQIAEHKDLNDDNQTVWVKVTTPDTGLFTRGLDRAASTGIIILISGAAVLAIGGISYVRFAKRRKIKF